MLTIYIKIQSKWLYLANHCFLRYICLLFGYLGRLQTSDYTELSEDYSIIKNTYFSCCFFLSVLICCKDLNPVWNQAKYKNDVVNTIAST